MTYILAAAILLVYALPTYIAYLLLKGKPAMTFLVGFFGTVFAKIVILFAVILSLKGQVDDPTAFALIVVIGAVACTLAETLLVFFKSRRF